MKLRPRTDTPDMAVRHDDEYIDNDYHYKHFGDSDMTSDSWIGGACNGHNITGLSVYEYGARPSENAMKEFFEQQILAPSNRYACAAAKQETQYHIPAAHYVFTAGPSAYGQKFADYIEKHGLGKLATIGKVDNKKYHPGSNCQVWVWSPDRAALISWWEKLKGINKAEAVAKEAPAKRVRKAAVPRVVVDVD